VFVNEGRALRVSLLMFEVVEMFERSLEDVQRAESHEDFLEYRDYVAHILGEVGLALNSIYRRHPEIMPEAYTLPPNSCGMEGRERSVTGEQDGHPAR